MKNSRNSTASGRILRCLCLFLSVLCVSLAGAPLYGCTSKEDKLNQTVVATCNGYDIKYEELRFLTLLYKDSLAATYGEGIWDDPATAETYRAELEGLVKEHLKENYVILTTCAAYQIDIDSDKADNYADQQVKELIEEEFNGKKSAYRAWLEENWMTDSFFRFSLRVSYLESALYYTLLDNHVFLYDTSNIDEYIDYVLTSDQYFRTVHVYVRNDEGESPEANLAEAQRVSQALHAVASADDRLKLMNSYIGSTVNDDLTSVSGDGYYFTIGEMDEKYEEEVLKLAIGEVSEAFACSNGYFVVMRLAPEEAYVINNCATLLRNYQASMLGLLEESYRDVCVVEYNEYGQSLDLLAIQ